MNVILVFCSNCILGQPEETSSAGIWSKDPDHWEREEWGGERLTSNFEAYCSSVTCFIQFLVLIRF